MTESPKESPPQRQYPNFYEKVVPIAIGVLVLIIVIMIIFAISVALGILI
jgi:hypothetical protein